MAAGDSSTEGPIRDDGGKARAMGIFPRQAESVAQARAWLSEFLAAQRVPLPVRDDAVLIMSELVTNALRHGLGEIVTRTSISDGGLHLSVTDSGRELPALQPVDPERIGGVGLQIVARLASQWGIAPFPGGKTVWASLGENAA